MKKYFFCFFLIALPILVLKSQSTITDVDGNIYTTDTIGTQIWMLQNLKTTKYNDGTEIANVTDSYAWTELSSGAYCWYNNNIGYKDIYGALYNWYAVASNKLCPIGWHVSTNAEWNTLATFLTQQGNTYPGQVLKSNTLWYNSNNGSDLYGFSAYPSGWRNGYFNNVGYFNGLSQYAIFWTATVYQMNQAYTRVLYFSSVYLSNRHFSKTDGFSVRCVKN